MAVGHDADFGKLVDMTYPIVRTRRKVEAHQGNVMPINELVTATAEDNVAKREAFEMGLAATKPLNAARLAQLCLLGERMRQTALRKSDAERDVCDATVQMPRSVDIPLPL